MDQQAKLDFYQRKASLLIQGVSFFLSLQQEFELRNELVQEYKKVLIELKAVTL